MGNCIAFQFQQKKQTWGPLVEEGEAELDSSMPIEKMRSGSGPHTRYILVPGKRQNGEVYYLAAWLPQSADSLVPCRTTDSGKPKPRKVKIVMTKKQLELLLSGAKLKHNSRVSRFRESPGLHRCRNWKLSLPTIPEVLNI